MKNIFILGGVAVGILVGCSETDSVQPGPESHTPPQATGRITIALSESASPSETWAAEDLADHLQQISGAEVPIITGSSLPEGSVIVVGGGAIATQLGIGVDDLGEEGYRIKTVGDDLVIAGGRQRGTMYGVYAFLEQLGCRWWYPGESTIPKMSPLQIPELDLTGTPALEYRDFLYGEMNDSDEAQLWRARNRVNGGFYKKMDEKLGSAVTFDTLVHSYNRLAPPWTYFKEHPEYYALRNGKRVQSQPCFSSTPMVELMAEAMKKEIAEHPEWIHFTVGQNDNDNYCQCEGCTALIDQFGPQGMQMHFAQRIATIVRETYPDIRFNVPAYEWSRAVPKGRMVPFENMSTTLCSIECNFGQPLAEGTSEINAEFRKDIEEWSAISERLLIWDYTTNFKHYLLPYPNYYVLTPNVKFFADHKAVGIMHQGANSTRNSQFSGLYLWVLAKSLWNPDSDGIALIEEFMNGYYGPAGKPLLAFMNEVHASMLETQSPLFCRWVKATYPNAAYLTPQIIENAERHFLAAEQSVQGDEELSRRVRYAYMQVQYVVLRRPRELWANVLAVRPDADWKSYASGFADTAREAVCNDLGENLPAKNFLEWADEYGARRSAKPNSDLPPSLQGADLSKIRLIQAASFDTSTTSMKASATATDGWVQQVTTSGWSIQHRMAPPFDFTPGKQYKLFVRARATFPEATPGTLLHAGFHPRPRGKIDASQLTSEFQDIEVATFIAGAEPMSFYTCLDKQTSEVVSDVEVDCIWLLEM